MRSTSVSAAFAVLAALALLAGTPTSATAQPVQLRAVAYNIRHGRGTDDVVDLERIADVLRRLDADVITLQEVDDRTERTGKVDQVAVLAALLGYEGRHGPHRPYEGGFYGNAVLTRLPVLAQRTHPIPPASGSALAVHETVVEAAPGLAVSIVSVHLAGTPEERMAQARAVSDAFDEAPGSDVTATLDVTPTLRVTPASAVTILAGDFNGRPDDAVVEYLGTRWTIGAKRGDPHTYPAGTPDREIDFVMWRTGARGSPGAGGAAPPGGPTLELLDHVVVDEPLASDHRPLLAVFRIYPS